MKDTPNDGSKMYLVNGACHNCLFWDLVLDGRTSDLGYCRRNAPQVPATMHIPKLPEIEMRVGNTETRFPAIGWESECVRAAWPETHKMDWCGEWRKRPEEEPDAKS